MKHETFAPLAEPYVVQDTYVTGVHDVEHLGDGEYRLIFFVKQRSICDDTSGDRVVAARLVMSLPAVFALAKLALHSIGVKCCGALGRAGLVH